MAQNSKVKAANSATQTPARKAPVRTAYTLERAIKLSPNPREAEAMEQRFALPGVEFHAIREITEEMVVKCAQAISSNMNEQALSIHMQRVVGSFVGSACGAGDFYSAKVSTAIELTTRLMNDSRDEDRDAVLGFETKAQRARHFAAQVGLQAYALVVAAQGAVDAYAHVTGSDWRPYQPDIPADATVARRAAEAELEAFNIR